MHSSINQSINHIKSLESNMSQADRRSTKKSTVIFLTSEHHRSSTVIPNYTARSLRRVCASGLPRAVLGGSVSETRTRDLSITSPTLYHLTTEPDHNLKPNFHLARHVTSRHDSTRSTCRARLAVLVSTWRTTNKL